MLVKYKERSDILCVYSIVTTTNGDLFLISHDKSGRHVELLPSNDFILLDDFIPEDWKNNYGENFYDNGHIGLKKTTVKGYDNIVFSPTHILNLIDSPSKEDIKIFLDNKLRIDLKQLSVSLLSIKENKTKNNNLTLINLIDFIKNNFNESDRLYTSLLDNMEYITEENLKVDFLLNEVNEYLKILKV